MTTSRAEGGSLSKLLTPLSVAAGITAITAAYVKMNLSPQHTGFLSKPEIRALGLSTFAGLSTSVGAGIAVVCFTAHLPAAIVSRKLSTSHPEVWALLRYAQYQQVWFESMLWAQVRKPDDSTLAFLLGLAMGVMLTLSVVELWLKNAMENGWATITMATLMGAGVYYVLQPFFPEFEVCFSIDSKSVIEGVSCAFDLDRTGAPCSSALSVCAGVTFFVTCTVRRTHAKALQFRVHVARLFSVSDMSMDGFQQCHTIEPCISIARGIVMSW
jgi:hypothetical protein